MFAASHRIAGSLVLALVGSAATASAQAPPASITDSNTPLHLLKPDYPVPYGPPEVEAVTGVLHRVLDYLEAATPARVVDRRTGRPIADPATAGAEPALEPGSFRVTSYEWGVVYSGMLLAAETTGEPRFREYVARRLRLVVELAAHYRAHPLPEGPLRSVLEPRALDDAGSLCAAMIKATQTGVDTDLRPLIDNFIGFISTKEFRLPDGTLARNRPQPSTLWLDDLYMSVPALAQMGALTGERRYFDDAVKQVLQFHAHLWDPQVGLYAHGKHLNQPLNPEFYWARANGWAMLASVELLDVLPRDHPGRETVLQNLRAHIRSVAKLQSGTSGLWHQMLDKTDSYLETSASALFVYSIARAIDAGWISPASYGSVAQAGWIGVTTRVNARGQVEGTCVGTTLASDHVYYYNRPQSVYATHGYGPVLLAGAEMIRLLQNPAIDIQYKLRTYHYVPKAP